MKEKGKILVVEDNKDWQSTLRGILEDEGYYVEVSKDLPSALKRLKSELFHFVTIDLQLNENTTNPAEYEGWDVIKQIFDYNIGKHTSTMVITGFDEDYEKFKSIKKLYAFHSMAKSDFDQELFIDIINRDIDRFSLSFYNDHRK